MDEVTRRIEVYNAADNAIVSTAPPPEHVEAVWKCAMVPLARHYVAERLAQVEARCAIMFQTVDGSLWRWIAACSEDQRRTFRMQYQLRFGQLRFAVGSPRPADSFSSDHTVVLSLSVCVCVRVCVCGLGRCEKGTRRGDSTSPVAEQEARPKLCRCAQIVGESGDEPQEIARRRRRRRRRKGGR
jgi:hypothetical protein